MPSRFAQHDGSHPKKSRFASDSGKSGSDDPSFIDRLGGDLKDFAVGTGVGVAEIGKAIGEDVYHGRGIFGLPTKAVTLGHVGDNKRGQVDKLVEQIAKATYHSFGESIHHPLRHPGDTALNAISLLSLGVGGTARLANAARLASAGEKGAALKALTFPEREARFAKLTTPEGKTITVQRGSYSRGALTKVGQKAADRKRGSGYSKRNQNVVGRETRRNAQIQYELAKVPAAQLQRSTKKLTDVQATALRVAAEGVHVKDRINLLEGEAAKTRSASLKRALKNEIVLLDQSRRHLDETGLHPVLSDPKLKPIFDKIKSIADRREQILLESGVLSPEQAAFRKSAPGRVALGAEFQDGVLTGAEHFNVDTVPDLIRIPYKKTTLDRVSGRVKGVGQGGVVGRQNLPGTVNHGFMGVIMRKGGGVKNVGRLVAQDYLEAARWWNSEKTRQTFREIGVHDPHELVSLGEKDLVAVRTEPNVKIRPELKSLIAKHEEGVQLTKFEKREIAKALDAEFEHVFPKVAVSPQDGIVWIPRRLLGGMDRAPATAALDPFSTAGKVIRGVDAINDAQKFAILYLKPAYAIPNMLGNLALTMVQQGVFAPKNLATAARLNAKLGEDVAAAIDTLMGEGIYKQLDATASASHLTKALVTGASHAFSTFVDRPFRRASFLHEARARGFKSAEQIKSLLEDEAHHDRLLETVKAANRDLIDYSNLTPFEQNVIRRVVFFYPWVKGAAVYTARFVREHPLQAAGANQLGSYALEKQREDLGALPTYASSLMRVGGTDELPRVINPAGAGIFSAPFDLVNSVLTGQPSENLTPAAGALMTLFSGQNRLGFNPRANEKNPYKRGLNNALTAGEGLYQGNPVQILVDRLRGGDQSGKTYQYSDRDALLQYLLGGAVAPRTANRAKLNQAAEQGR